MRRRVDFALTQHARARMQQRGLSAEALECLLAYGRRAYDHAGHVVVLYFDKQARRRLARAAGQRKDLERLARCYAVLSHSGEVLTVGYRYRRILRN
jgi:hypothetical protein